MKLVIASNNFHKIEEIKDILGSHFESIQSMREAHIELDERPVIEQTPKA